MQNALFVLQDPSTLACDLFLARLELVFQLAYAPSGNAVLGLQV